MTPARALRRWTFELQLERDPDGLNCFVAFSEGDIMPRYYFRLTDGKQILDIHRGIDLPGNAAALTDAVALAQDLKRGNVMSGWDWTGWVVAVVDQHGHKVDEVPIADA